MSEYRKRDGKGTERLQNCRLRMVQTEILDFLKCGRMCIYDAIVCKLTKSLGILDGTADGALQQ